VASNSFLIIVATVALFIARAFHLKFGELLGTTAIALIFAGIGFVLDRLIDRLRRDGEGSQAGVLSLKWTPYLLFGWIVSLSLVILDVVFNFSISTPRLVFYFGGLIPSILIFSLLAAVLTVVKAKQFDGHDIAFPYAYVGVAAIVNAVMLYLFVFAL
jgi:hypothetical protein